MLPLTVVVILLSFIVYSTWAAFQNAHYFADPYLSPFYSPCITKSCLHQSFGWALPDISLPIMGLVSPAFLILAGPGVFRLTCYYYRKAYYRSFWLAPAACAVRDAKSGYTGETRFPLFLQNFHRYTWYVAVLFIVMLTWDALLAFRFKDGFGIGVGTHRDVDQRAVPGRLHVLLPLLPARVRRGGRRVLQGPGALLACGAGSPGSTRSTRCSPGCRSSAWA